MKKHFLIMVFFGLFKSAIADDQVSLIEILPKEIQIEILKYMPAKELSEIYKVSKNLNQSIIELFKAYPKKYIILVNRRSKGFEPFKYLVESLSTDTKPFLQIAVLRINKQNINKFLALCNQVVNLQLVCSDGLFVAKEIANSPYTKNLKSLDLSFSAIDYGGVMALCTSPYLILESLILFHCQIYGGIFEIASAKNFKNLKFLDLGNNEISDSAARALVESTSFTNLNYLNLKANETWKWNSETIELLKKKYPFVLLD